MHTHSLWIVFALLPLLAPTPSTAVQLKMCSSFQAHLSHFTFSFLSPHMLTLGGLTFFLRCRGEHGHSQILPVTTGGRTASQYMLLFLG